MVIESRNSVNPHYFDLKSLIWSQIFYKNLSISIAMSEAMKQSVTPENRLPQVFAQLRNDKSKTSYPVLPQHFKHKQKIEIFKKRKSD